MLRPLLLSAVAAFALGACSHPATPSSPTPARITAVTAPSASPATSLVIRVNGPISDVDLEKMCLAKLPSCRHPYAEALPSKSPCAYRGALCEERFEPIDFLCGCEMCRSDADCASGQQCYVVQHGCPYVQHPMTCNAPPQRLEPSCPPEDPGPAPP